MIKEINEVFAWIDTIGTNNSSTGFLSYNIDEVCFLNLVGVNGFTNMVIGRALFDALYARHGEYDPRLVSTPIVSVVILTGWLNALARQIAIDELLLQLP